MILKTRMLGQTYEFKDVKDVLAKASEKKSGDELAGVGAESALERIAAKAVSYTHLHCSRIVMDGAKISAFPFILRISSIPNVVFPEPGAATICIFPSDMYLSACSKTLA